MRLKPVLTTVLVALMLVIGIDYVSFAATGQSLLLGKANSANALTSISRSTSGPVLALNAQSGSAPFTVNRTIKVANLNADRVDGYDGQQVLNRTRLFSTPVNVSSASSFSLTLSNVPAGKYLFTSNAFLYTSTSSAKACYLLVPTTGQRLYEWFPADTSGGFVMPNGTGLVTLPTQQDLTYSCYDNTGALNSWSTLEVQPLQLTLSPLAQVTSGSFAPAAAGFAGPGADAAKATR